MPARFVHFHGIVLVLHNRRMSRRTMANIKHNRVFAFICNAAGGAIATGVPYQFPGLLVRSSIAAVAMSLISVSAVGNALRLRRANSEEERRHEELDHHWVRGRDSARGLCIDERGPERARDERCRPARAWA